MSRVSPKIKAHNKKATGSRLETMDLGISNSSSGIVETSKKSSRVKPTQDQNINHQTTAKTQLNVKLEAKGETVLNLVFKTELVEIVDRPPNVSAGADKVSIIEVSLIDGLANSNSVNFVPQVPSLDSTGRDDDLSQANFLSEHRSSCHRCGNIRKQTSKCPRCPHIFCDKCREKMLSEDEKCFTNGCPVCLNLCCCFFRSENCTKEFHCYKKCPAVKRSNASTLSTGALTNADIESGGVYTVGSASGSNAPRSIKDKKTKEGKEGKVGKESGGKRARDTSPQGLSHQRGPASATACQLSPPGNTSLSSSPSSSSSSSSPFNFNNATSSSKSAVEFAKYLKQLPRLPDNGAATIPGIFFNDMAINDSLLSQKIPSIGQHLEKFKQKNTFGLERDFEFRDAFEDNRGTMEDNEDNDAYETKDGAAMHVDMPYFDLNSPTCQEMIRLLQEDDDDDRFLLAPMENDRQNVQQSPTHQTHECCSNISSLTNSAQSPMD